MSTVDAIPGNATISNAAPLPHGRRSLPLAALLSLLLPGLGQWYAGRRRRAVGWIAGDLLVGVIMLAGIAYIPADRWNVVVSVALWALYRLTVAVAAWRIAQRHGVGPIARYQRWWACLLAAACIYAGHYAFAHVVRSLWFETFVLPTAGMAETLLPGDRFIVDKLWYRHQPLRHGDIVVFFSDGPGSYILIQRVIGLPGDVIEARDEVLYRNGEPLDEPYANIDEDVRVWSATMATFPPITVPVDELFLVGDNRRLSEDSRYRGTTPVNAVVGRAWTIYWSSPPPSSPWQHRSHQTRAHAPADEGVRWDRIGRRLR